MLSLTPWVAHCLSRRYDHSGVEDDRLPYRARESRVSVSTSSSFITIPRGCLEWTVMD